MKYVNTSEMTRVWTSLQGPDGRTLQLAPGETVDLPEAVDDPHLKPVDLTPVGPARKTKRAKDEQPDLSGDSTADANDTPAPGDAHPDAANSSQDATGPEPKAGGDAEKE